MQDDKQTFPFRGMDRIPFPMGSYVVVERYLSFTDHLWKDGGWKYGIRSLATIFT